MTDLRMAGEVSTGELLDGRYLLEERIGEGGMARVYRAQDTHLNRTVAVKVMRGPVDAPETLERARAETRVLASLNHHSLVTVFDARLSEDEGSYITMEYVDGITLRDRIHSGPMDERDVAGIALDVAEALHVAHSAGIVHRDVKPSNVLLRRSPLPGSTWRAKLADFGIAFLLDSTRLTTPGLIIGTAAYIAPEQAQGAPPAPPADIYAFGLMLIEALTGTRPYADAEGIGAVMARLMSPPPIPETLRPEWQGLLRGMTASRPDDRPSALEVAAVAAKLSAMLSPPPADRPTEAVAVETRPTALLPASAPDAFPPTRAYDALETRPMAAGAAAARLVESGRGGGARRSTADARQRRSRRRMVLALVGAAVAVLALAAAVWTLSLVGATPDPDPTTPLVVPSVAPTEDITEEAPAPVVEEETESVVEEVEEAEEVVDDDKGNSDKGNDKGKGDEKGNGGGKGNSVGGGGKG